MYTDRVSGKSRRYLASAQLHEFLRDGLPRLIGLSIMVLIFSVLLSNMVLAPSKRNLEVFAALIFTGIVLISHPNKALYFTLFVTPYPAYTTVGSTSTLLILALAGLVLVKAKQVGIGTPFVDRRSDIPLVALAMAILVSIYRVPPEHMSNAMLKMQGIVSAICLYYVIVAIVNTKRDLFRVIDVVCLAAASLYLIAFLQSLFPERTILPAFFKFTAKVASMEDVRRGHIRVFATFPGYELFAEFVTLTLFLQYLRLRRSVAMLERALRLGVILLGLAVLVATATRGGVIMLLVGWLILLTIGGRVVPRREIFQVMFVALALFYLTLPFFYDYYSFMIERLSDMAAGKDVDSLNGRTDVFSQAFDGMARRPLLGHGFYSAVGTFRGFVTMNIHNLYLDLGYKAGLPALLFFLTFVARLLTNCWRILRSSLADPELREAALFLFAMLIMFLIDEFKIEFTRDPLTMHTTFTMFAIAAATAKVARRTRHA